MSEGDAGELTELLQQLIRNACVNDGTPASGHESRSVDTLRAYLGTAGLDVQTYEPLPDRTSLVARIDGSDPSAPSLLLMGHTDVVPVNPGGWRRDPFGGELVEGEVWGRGAVDMLNLTASMAFTMRHLADSGFRPSGTLIFAAVADEEALGTHGAKWLAEHALDDVKADYVITESGGIPMTGGDGAIRLPIMVGEKGSYWCTLRVRGTPGHASQPLRTDNALVKAAEVVRRIAAYQPAADLHDVWRSFVTSMGFPDEIAASLLDPSAIEDFCQTSPAIGLARQAHACTHTTFAPTIMQAGTKTNVIPDQADIQIDIRTLPGQSEDDIRAQLGEILGDLAPDVEIVAAADDPSTSSPAATPLSDALQRVVSRFYPGSSIVPMFMVGATDARFFRRAGVPSYGFGLFSEKISFDQFATMFHGDNERIDVDSLGLSAALWEALSHDFLCP